MIFNILWPKKKTHFWSHRTKNWGLGERQFVCAGQREKSGRMFNLHLQVQGMAGDLCLLYWEILCKIIMNCKQFRQPVDGLVTQIILVPWQKPWMNDIYDDNRVFYFSSREVHFFTFFAFSFFFFIWFLHALESIFKETAQSFFLHYALCLSLRLSFCLYLSFSFSLSCITPS